LPLIEKLSIQEKQKDLEKLKLNQRKQILNDNILRMKNEYKNGNDTTIKCNDIGFIFECDFAELESKSLSKDLNFIGSAMDKENIKGTLYVICGDDVCFSVRGEDALERGKSFCGCLSDGIVNGKDKCANGKGKLKL